MAPSPPGSRKVEGRQARRRVGFARRLAFVLALGLVGYAGFRAFRFYQVERSITRIRTLLSAGENAQARSLALEIVGIRPSAETWFFACRTAWLTGRFADARDDLHTAQRLGWPTPLCQLELLLIDAGSGKFAEVEPVLLAALASKLVHDPELYAALVHGYSAAFRFESALHCLEAWVDDFPDDIRPRLWRPEVNRRLERDSDGSLEDYRRALAIDPDRYEARLGTAEIHFDLDEHEKARRWYLDCLARKPDDLTARFGLARCQYRLGANEEAVSSFQQVLEGEPLNALAMLEIAKIDLEEGRVDRGVERLRKVVAIEPHGADGWYQLSLGLARSGQRDQAAAAVEQYKRITIFNDRFETRRKELESDPNNLEVLHAIVADFLDLGIEKEAVFWARRILQIDPRDELALKVVRGAADPTH